MYQLTDSKIEIGDTSINRIKFEEWLTDRHDIDSEDLERYWAGKTERDPISDLVEYIRIYKTPNEFDMIFGGIQAITKSFS